MNPKIIKENNFEQDKVEAEGKEKNLHDNNDKPENRSFYNFEEKYIRTASEKINELIMSRVRDF